MPQSGLMNLMLMMLMGGNRGLFGGGLAGAKMPGLSGGNLMPMGGLMMPMLSNAMSSVGTRDPRGQKVTPRVSRAPSRPMNPNFTPNPKTPRNLAIERDKAARITRDKRARFNAWQGGIRGPGEGR